MPVDDPNSTAATGDRSNTVAEGVLATLWVMKYRHHFAQEKTIQARTYEGAKTVAEKYLQGLRGSKLIEIRPFIQLSEKWLDGVARTEAAEKKETRESLGLDPIPPAPAAPVPPAPPPPRDPRLPPPADAIPIREKK